MNRRTLGRVLGMALFALLMLTAVVQAVTLEAFLEAASKNHPLFAKEAMSVEIEETRRQRYLGAEDWVITSSPYFLHQKPVGSSAFASERVDLLSLNAGAERAFWRTGGRLSVSVSSDVADQRFPEIELPGFSIPLGPERFYQHRIYAIYSHPLLQNYRGKLDRLEYELAEYAVDLSAIQSLEEQEGFLLDLGARFLEWTLLSEQSRIAADRLRLAEEQLQQTERRRRANLIDEVDVLRAEDAVRIARQSTMLIESQWKSKQAELAVLAVWQEIYYAAPEYDLYELADLPSPEQAVSVLTVRSRLLRTLATLREQLLHQRAGLVEAARPQLFLNVGAGLQGGEDEFGESLLLDKPDLLVGAELRVPLGNRTARTDIQVSDLQLERLELEMGQVALDLEAGVSSLLIQIEELRAVLALNLEQIESARKKTEEEERLYNQGRGELTFVIQSRDNEESAKLRYAQNAATYQQLVLHYRALMDELYPLTADATNRTSK
ncbi:MAG: TolC family protein [Candidatus Eiseniibacteriota bacterium]|nr:MAG: TolC family protein [Candidatus Eisenbacteria bacterium]